MITNITVQQADITTIQADAIVNAANSSLLGGGGVDGAIHRAGGPAILQECLQIRNQQGGCPTGEAVITAAGNLPAKMVIHTVGPVYVSGDKHIAQLLHNCYINSLTLAMEHNLKTIAFPNISTGIYGYPKAEAAGIAIRAVQEFIGHYPSAFTNITFVCYDRENFMHYHKMLQ